jgi:ribA/ribD-fused uncharacterized protein
MQHRLQAENERLRRLNRVLEERLQHQKTLDERIENLMAQAGMGCSVSSQATARSTPASTRAARLSEIPSLNNWSAHQLLVRHITFATAEHAYQYFKVLPGDALWAQEILHAPSPWEAKRLSRRKPINHQAWDTIRRDVMLEILNAKLLQHSDVRQALQATEHYEIVEDGSLEPYWGIGTAGNGANMFGAMWMSLRAES